MKIHINQSLIITAPAFHNYQGDMTKKQAKMDLEVIALCAAIEAVRYEIGQRPKIVIKS